MHAHTHTRSDTRTHLFGNPFCISISALSLLHVSVDKQQIPPGPQPQGRQGPQGLRAPAELWLLQGGQRLAVRVLGIVRNRDSERYKNRSCLDDDDGGLSDDDKAHGDDVGEEGSGDVEEEDANDGSLSTSTPIPVPLPTPISLSSTILIASWS